MNNKAQTPNALQTEKLVREATNELGDYFSRLGGSARYQGMEETDIPMFVCFLIAELANLDLNSFDYHWVQTFKRHGEGSVAKAKEILASRTWTKDIATRAIDSYVVQVNKVLRTNSHGQRWINFLEHCGSK